MPTRALGHISKFFNCSWSATSSPPSPCAATTASEGEPRAIACCRNVRYQALWHACDGLRGAAGPRITLLLLSGPALRRSPSGRSAARSSGRRVDAATRRKPKYARHEVPLTRRRSPIIDSIRDRRDSSCSPPCDLGGLGKMSRSKAARAAQMSRKLHGAGMICGARRRPAGRRSLQAACIEKVLNHKSGSFRVNRLLSIRIRIMLLRTRTRCSRWGQPRLGARQWHRRGAMSYARGAATKRPTHPTVAKRSAGSTIASIGWAKRYKMDSIKPH